MQENDGCDLLFRQTRCKITIYYRSVGKRIFSNKQTNVKSEMNAMKKMICAPGSYIQGSGELGNLAEYCRAVGGNGAYLIVSKSAYAAWKERIDGGFQKSGMPYAVERFGGECCREEICKHLEQSKNYDVIVGIGGGKVLDTAKAAAFYAQKRVIIVPTIASTDAPCSRLAVIYSDQGVYECALALRSNPDIVLADTEIIAKAPVRFLTAGIGDALATYYEADACEKSGAETTVGGYRTTAAPVLAKLCRDNLLEYGVQAQKDAAQGELTPAVEKIIETNIYLSGIGFESGGLAAAHAVHNGLTVLEETHRLLHGEKVAFGTLVQLVLERRSADEIHEILAFCRACGLPTTLRELGLEHVGDDRLLEAAKASCQAEDTMGNLPFAVTPEDVLAAMKLTDLLSRTFDLLDRRV